MDNFNFYDTQVVDETHLDGMQADTENSHNDTHRVTGITGINLGITLSAHAADPGLGIVAELTVGTDARAFSPQGERIVPTDGTLIQMLVDGDGNAITPASSGNSKIHRVFMVYVRAESAPALAPGNITIQTRLSDSARLYVRAGAEYTTGGSKVFPTKNADELIVGDVELDFGATEVLAPDIDLSLATKIYKTPGGTSSDSPTDFIADYDAEIRGYIDGAASLFPFGQVSPDDLGLGSTIDGQINPDTTVSALAELMNQLQMNSSVGAHGAKFLGIKNANLWANADFAIDSTNDGSAPASTEDNLGNAVTEVIKGLANKVTDRSGASRVGLQTAGGGGIQWKDAQDFEVGGRDTVYLGFSGIVSDLGSQTATTSGADKIGYPVSGSTEPEWADGVDFQDGTTTTVYNAISKVVTDLADNSSTETDNGAHKIGMNPSSTRRWANNEQIDRSVASDSPNIPTRLDEVFYRLQKDLARTDATNGPGFERVGVDSTDSVESDMMSSGDALATGQLSEMLSNIKDLIEVMPVRNKNTDVGGIFTQLAGLALREKGYLDDTTPAESDDMTSGTFARFNLVFKFDNDDGGGGNPIRVYTNNYVFVVTYNAEWIDSRVFTTGMNNLNIAQKWKADTDTVSSVAMMIGDCRRAMIDADQHSTAPIFQASLEGGIDGELAYPNSGDVDLGAGDGQIDQYTSVFSGSGTGGTADLPFMILTRHATPGVIDHVGWFDDGLKNNWIWTNGIQNTSTGDYGWLWVGFKMAADFDGSGAGSGYEDWGFTFTGFTDGIA